MTTRRVRIATRQSALALWQAEHVAARLRALYADLEVVLVPMTTRGDQIIDQPLAAIGGKGLFLKELEVAIAEGRADLAVHSMKDVPMALEDGFAIAAVLERADPFDAFVSARAERLADLPEGARVGTSSLRRQAQLKAQRPDLHVTDLRGNVNTRLAKLDAGLYDAIILACAGLERLGLGARIRERLAAPAWLPAVAQGAIGIECGAGRDDIVALLAPLRHAPTETCVAAERAMNLRLHGSCDVPVAGFAQLAGPDLTLDALVGDAASGRIVRASATMSSAKPQVLGDAVAQKLFDAGAEALLKRH